MSEIELLQADIAALPATMATPEVYREACALMFFRYGVTPTANKLYSAVKRGSMSTPVAVLKAFWAELREKSRVRIEGSDLPEELASSGGELLSALWRQARAAAEAQLAERTAALAEKEAEFAAQLKAAQVEHERLETALAHRTENVLGLQLRLQERETALDEAQARATALTCRIGELESLVTTGREALALAERDFAGRLEKLMASGQETAARAAAAEKRLLLEIDRERILSTRLQKELDAGRASASRAAEQAAGREAALTRELEMARQRLGEAETTVAVHSAARATLAAEVADLKSEVVELRVKLAASEASGRALPSPDALEQGAVDQGSTTSARANQTDGMRAKRAGPRRTKKPRQAG